MEGRAPPLEYDEDADGLPAVMARSYPTQQCSQWVEACLEENLTTAVDWLVAVYPGPTKDPGWTPNKEKRLWARDMTAFADSLAANCGLGAALFLSLASWPNVDKDLTVMGTGREVWSSHVTTLQNTAHGGHIESHHQSIFTLAPGLGRHFSLPTTSAEPPGVNERDN